MSKDKFYSTKAWEAMRMRVIRESRHKCQNCARYGKMQDATTVHHANPIEERPDLRLKRWNLIALCDECHNKMHDRSTHKLTALGERWRMRVSPLLAAPPETTLFSARKIHTVSTNGLSYFFIFLLYLLQLGPQLLVFGL
mgnify:CR=1 FL=1